MMGRVRHESRSGLTGAKREARGLGLVGPALVEMEMVMAMDVDVDVDVDVEMDMDMGHCLDCGPGHVSCWFGVFFEAKEGGRLEGAKSVSCPDDGIGLVGDNGESHVVGA